MGSLKKWFSSLSPGVQLVVAIVVIYLLWQLWKYASAYITNASKLTSDKGEIAALNNAGFTQTYGSATYESWADKLEIAMKGFGTKEAVIFSVFNALKNDIDFIKLDQAFNIRDGANMKTWLRDDLGSDDINTINSRLKTAGLTKRI